MSEKREEERLEIRLPYSIIGLNFSRRFHDPALGYLRNVLANSAFRRANLANPGAPVGLGLEEVFGPDEWFPSPECCFKAWTKAHRLLVEAGALRPATPVTIDGVRILAGAEDAKPSPWGTGLILTLRTPEKRKGSIK